MMGLRLETAAGQSIAIKAAKEARRPSHDQRGGTTGRDPDQTGQVAPGSHRPQAHRWRQQSHPADRPQASTIDDLHAALDPVIDKNATPDLVPAGSMVLQPSEERRRSGSHYTPRELTEPIVRIALEPIFDRLQQEADGPLRPEQILDLKVCDPAMGSGAFLVEACRQLADALIESWWAHSVAPEIPPDEDEVIFARRQVAQRCLYGVDRNPKAVDLAKLSLWLITLAKEHPLTFLDHALRHGDSLVGLSIPQLQAFHWKGDAPHFEEGFEALQGRTHLTEAAELRQLIREADDSVSDRELRELWDQAQSETASVRLLGDFALAAFFQESKSTDREARLKEFATKVIDGEADTYGQWLDDLRNADPPLAPFHWQIEFPEVFARENSGFDSIVGNPPFGGHVTVVAANTSGYAEWLRYAHSESSGKCDLVAHFFRRSFDLIRVNGTVGLIATNTIAQGDTRNSGLRWICTNGGEIYNARRRITWPGAAAVVVSVVHISKGHPFSVCLLDDQMVESITAFLLSSGGHDDPPQLTANSGMSFQGSIVLGMGFTFDDTDTKGVASSLATMQNLIDLYPRTADAIYPYIGGKEVNDSPIHTHHRYIINFGERTEQECRDRWPQLFKIVEAKVKPERISKNAEKYPRMVHERRKYWNARPELHISILALDRVLVNSQVSQRTQFAFLSCDMVYSHALNICPLDTYAAFCTLQSRLHEAWALSFGSSMKDDLRYTPSDCFETRPFPQDWQTKAVLEVVDQQYYEFRASLMVRNDEGMTTTYNRFHDPCEDNADIAELRRLHANMDRAVLDAYGWDDIPTDCEFPLDYEIDEETWGAKRKPYRYRWPDDIRDDVLAGLLELNAERAAEEARAGLTGSKKGKGTRRGQARSSTPGTGTASLFEADSLSGGQ
ncbi:MAG: N-6 DNA methylase [Chloroflexota bacterium]|nr:N-6 DNA methylase [Chloroflexota bacterium]